ncbi:MAG: hypothetical protein ACF8XB_24175 [Planctomycetota bacterium JB042]
MTRSHRATVRTVLALAVLALPPLTTGCCATRNVWSDVDNAPKAAVATVATPFALAADVVLVPLHAAWILATAGGHGEPWVDCD